MGRRVDDELVAARRRFDRLVRLYPRRYRRQYGIPLRDTLLDQYRALPVTERRAGRYWVRLALDTVANAVALHAAYLAAGQEELAKPRPIRAGALVGVVAGLCFALGAALGELPASPLAHIEESLANVLSLAFLLIVCAVSGWWTARWPRALSRGAVSGAVTGGLAGFCTGLAYVAIDQLFLAVVARQPEKQAAFAHSQFVSLRAYLLVTTVEATIVLALFGLVVGALVGGVAGGTRRLLRA